MSSITSSGDRREHGHGINQSIANLKQRLAKEGRDPDKADAALDEALHPSPTALATSGATS